MILLRIFTVARSNDWTAQNSLPFLDFDSIVAKDQATPKSL